MKSTKKDNLKDLMDICYDIKIGLGKNCTYDPITVFALDGRLTKIIHQKNEVLLIDFWATWCKFCQSYMQENVNYANKQLKDSTINEEKEQQPKSNEHENKNINELKKTDLTSNQNHQKDTKALVKIVGLSCDDHINAVKAHIEEKGWDSIDHYIKKTIREELHIKMIPCICVVNREGKIVYFGHPKHFDLERDLENLLIGNDLAIVDKETLEFSNKKDEDKIKCVKLIDNLLGEKELNNLRVNVSIESEFNFEKEAIVNNFCKVVFYGKAAQYEIDACKALEGEIKEIFSIGKN